MNPFIKNINIFSGPNKFFSTKTFEKLDVFKRLSEFFEKIILRVSGFMIPKKSREMPGEFYYQVDKFIKKLKK